MSLQIQTYPPWKLIGCTISHWKKSPKGLFKIDDSSSSNIGKITNTRLSTFVAGEPVKCYITMHFQINENTQQLVEFDKYRI